jgi:CubicO group peptidase (beta-lactamase class C family)
MKLVSLLAGTAALVFSAASYAQSETCDGYPLATAADPAAANWSASDIETLQALATELESSSLMVVQGGEIVFSHGDVEQMILLHSLRKSIMSALIGTLVDEGALSLDSTLADLQINDLQPLTETELTANVQNIISAQSGVYIPSAAETPAMAAARPERGSHAPGEFWYYNNWDFNVAGHIFERVSYRNYNSVFLREFVEPLCMQDFDIFETYRQHAPGTMFSAYHMRFSARDLALFGQLFLQNGLWNDEQILSPEWVADSTSHHAETSWNGAWMGGYGYMWWLPRNEESAAENNIPADMYTGAGYGGQYLTVIPSMDMVIVNRMNTDDPEGARMGADAYTRVLQAVTAAAAPD